MFPDPYLRLPWDDLCPLYNDSPFFCTDTELFDTEPSYIQITGAQEAVDVEFRPGGFTIVGGNYIQKRTNDVHHLEPGVEHQFGICGRLDTLVVPISLTCNLLLGSVVRNLKFLSCVAAGKWWVLHKSYLEKVQQKNAFPRCKRVT